MMTDREVKSMFRFVLACRKCSHSAQSGVTIKSQFSTGQALSTKTVLHNSFSTESDDIVPLGQ